MSLHHAFSLLRSRPQAMPEKKQAAAWQGAVAGAIGNAFSRTAIAPLERTRMQMIADPGTCSAVAPNRNVATFAPGSPQWSAYHAVWCMQANTGASSTACQLSGRPRGSRAVSGHARSRVCVTLTPRMQHSICFREVRKDDHHSPCTRFFAAQAGAATVST